MKRRSRVFALTALTATTLALPQQAPPQTVPDRPAGTTPQSQSPSASNAPMPTGAGNANKQQSKTLKVLYVTLNETTNPWTVDIGQCNKENEVSRSSSRQTIIWVLTGEAKKGTILPLKWLPPAPPPPDPPLGAFTIYGLGKRAKMSDQHLNTGDTKGEWFYQFTIEVGGTQYHSIDDQCSWKTNTNPSIKNK